MTLVVKRDRSINPPIAAVILEDQDCSRRPSDTSPPAQAVHPAPLELGVELSGEIVLQRAGHACLYHLMCNEQAGRAGDAEGIHQMRVAVRRLRGILSAFTPLLPPGPRRWASNELRWFAGALGEARNLDVFAAALLGPARAALPAASEFGRLAMTIERRRRVAHTAARRAIASARFGASVRALTKWFERCGWRVDGDGQELQRPIGELAPILLDRVRRQARKRGKGFAGQSEEQRHRLRIAMKKLRYACELLAVLYDPVESKRFIQRLKRLQDDLGDINDVHVGREIVVGLAEPGAPETGIALAGRRMFAWHARRLADNEPRLRRRLQQLLETKPFWPGAEPVVGANSACSTSWFDLDQCLAAAPPRSLSGSGSGTRGERKMAARTRGDDAHRQTLEYRHLSPDERRAKGKALRRPVPREDHGGWEPAKDRRDPIEVLIESDEGRLPELVPIRHGRMMQSPFAFYRGGAAIMAGDLAHTAKSGHIVQACGDAHLMNFGGFATPERKIIFDINDFDETLPAPWEWDLKRLAASIVVAARHIGLSESKAGRVATDAVRTYRERMTDYGSMPALDVWYDVIDLDRLLKAVTRDEDRGRTAARIEKARERSAPEYMFPKLTAQQGTVPRILDDPPLIFHPTAEQAPGLKTGYSDALARYRESLPENVRTLFDRYVFSDLAVKVVGVGSVGTICMVALFLAANDDALFLQFKEARASVLEPYAGESLHPNHGQRVVAGQRLMQSASDIFLGWTGGLNGKHYYIRQLRDAKISAIIEGFDLDLLQDYVRICAWSLARAHARSGDPAIISGYMGSSETFDEAIGEFAVEYADQNERDYTRFVNAVREGQIEAVTEP
jgi:CHAD domain-containing protein